MEHQCHCRACWVALAPARAFEEGVTFGVRFSQRGTIHINGEDVSSVVYEFHLDTGKVWMFSSPKHICKKCRQGVCCTLAEYSPSQIKATLK